ncbi:hypothetical protein [Shewanella canadensis]|uniref:hypothetical protein n=1 Tax=Shewanella canadensis TaxID=271096 RepID=UPI001639ECFB|nr:hypothetical protein [Shewanella canadensis]
MTLITLSEPYVAADYDMSPLEVAEGRWNKLREPDMDVWLAFGVQDVPSEAIAIYP